MTDIIPAHQAKLFESIRENFAAWKRSYEQQIEFAFNCGLALHHLKAQTPHGEFMKLRELHFPEISRSGVQRLMSFVDRLEIKLPSVGNLKADQLLLEDAAQKKAVLGAVYDLSDGKTITEFYRDLGVIRPPKKQQYHRPGPVDAHKQAAHEAKLARDHILTLAHDLELAREELHLVDDATRDALFDACLKITTFVREARKSGGRKTKCK